jgi:hypothetical protein
MSDESCMVNLNTSIQSDLRHHHQNTINLCTIIYFYMNFKLVQLHRRNIGIV